MKKRGQVKMSFGMIFSIILIVIFIAFAIYGIGKFLSLQKSITANQFVSNLQDDVTKAWEPGSVQTSVQKSYDLPNSISGICFRNNEDNLIFIDPDGYVKSGVNIDHLNISAMTSQGNLCFNNTDGKVSFTIKKDLGETLVTITK